MKQNLHSPHHSTKSFYYETSEYKLAIQNGVTPLKALILVGGFGTRLRPLSCTRPKALFPIINKPLLQWTFERLAKNRIEEVILATSYQTETLIKQHRLPKNGLTVIYSRDPFRKLLGTGGPIKKAEKLIGHESPFLVLNGDIFADINYTELLKTHEQKRAAATMALFRVEDPSRYGIAELKKGNCIKRFIEKPSRNTTSSHLINAGAYVLSPKIFNYIPESRAVSIEHEVFPKLARENNLYGYVFDGLWKDIGEPEEYLELNKILLESSVVLQKHKVKTKAKIEPPVAFDKGVFIKEKSVVGPHVILGQDVTIGESVRIRDSVAFSGVTISDHATIDGAIIGEGVVIGRKAKIDKGCMLGDYVRIKDGVSLAGGVLVCSAKEVSKDISRPKHII
jgi:mannose-1-phosphate guanylyltransferase